MYYMLLSRLQYSLPCRSRCNKIRVNMNLVDWTCPFWFVFCTESNILYGFGVFVSCMTRTPSASVYEMKIIIIIIIPQIENGILAFDRR